VDRGDDVGGDVGGWGSGGRWGMGVSGVREGDGE
jgi:hypothetical protein